MHAKWKPLIPDEFSPPRTHQQELWLFSQLTVEDIDEDYVAVVDSADRLRGTFDFFPEWPDKNISRKVDLSNLGWHQTEFEMKTSFAYKIQRTENNSFVYVGCAYIFPSNDPEFEIDAYLWVKNGYESKNQELFSLFRQWLKDGWHFQRIKFPGRKEDSPTRESTC